MARTADLDILYEGLCMEPGDSSSEKYNEIIRSKTIDIFDSLSKIAEEFEEIKKNFNSNKPTGLFKYHCRQKNVDIYIKTLKELKTCPILKIDSDLDKRYHYNFWLNNEKNKQILIELREERNHIEKEKYNYIDEWKLIQAKKCTVNYNDLNKYMNSQIKSSIDSGSLSETRLKDIWVKTINDFGGFDKVCYHYRKSLMEYAASYISGENNRILMINFVNLTDKENKELISFTKMKLDL